MKYNLRSLLKNKGFIIALAFFFVSEIGISQIVINELDTDNQGVDTEEFIELKSDNPYFSLDAYVVVLFNGSNSAGNTSYYTIDLDGLTTDINGLFVIGSNEVSPIPQLEIPTGVIQNGADAIAVYLGSEANFPHGTLATTNNLIDALVYDTNDADDTDLMGLLGVSVQINENQNGHKDTESIQRNNDGTYFVGPPTPRQLNDGSGVPYNGVDINVVQEQYDEGAVFNIEFTTQQIASEELLINLNLNNGTFDESDYSGIISLTIPLGQQSVSTTITLIDDSENEGDEELNIHLDDVSEPFILLKNDVIIRVVDNDFEVADWGTPINPTFGLATSTQASGYYDSLNGLSNAELRQALQDIVADPSIVRAQTYTDIIDILKEADQNPENSSQVWMVYTEEPRSKIDFQTSSDNTGKWNREHTFPRSRAGYYSIAADDTANGIDDYWNTNADSLRHGNSDGHALRVADGSENSTRGNKHYGQYTGPTGNLGSFKGDVARSVLFLDIRYNGLSIVDGFPNVDGQLGDLTTLLEWHRNDPPDDFEMNRNNVVYTWQFNRNPFIDQPDLVEYIWGNQTGEIWTAGIYDFDSALVKLYPSITEGDITIAGLEGNFSVAVFTFTGRKVREFNGNDTTSFSLNLSQGIYLARIAKENNSIVKRIIVK